MVTVPVPPPVDGGGAVSGVVVLGVVLVLPSFPGVVVAPPSPVVVTSPSSVVVEEVAVVVVDIVTFRSLSVAVQLYSTPVFRIKGSGYFLACANQNLFHWINPKSRTNLFETSQFVQETCSSVACIWGRKQPWEGNKKVHKKLLFCLAGEGTCFSEDEKGNDQILGSSAPSLKGPIDMKVKKLTAGRSWDFTTICLALFHAGGIDLTCAGILVLLVVLALSCTFEIVMMQG